MLSTTIIHACRRCGSERIRKNGHANNGAQRAKCLECGRTFHLEPKGPRYEEKFKAQVVAAYQDRDLHDDNVHVLYHSMNPWLQAESDWWQATAPRYGFGRVEVAPVHSTAEAVRLYLTKQDWRSCSWPFVETKSFRFWGCSTGLRAGTVKFAWNSPGSRACRQRLRDWAHQMGCGSLVQLPMMLGRNWGYEFLLHVRDLQTGGLLDVHEGVAEPAIKPMTQGRARGRSGIQDGSETPAESGFRKRMGAGTGSAGAARSGARSPGPDHNAEDTAFLPADSPDHRGFPGPTATGRPPWSPTRPVHHRSRNP